MHLLAALSMKNRALIALVTVVVMIFGGIALTSLKQELAPSIAFPQLAIMTQYPGASPDVVNDDVSTPIETSIQGITGLESTSTSSSTGVSVVSASFTYGTDMAFAEQKLLSAVNRISSTLPSGVEPQVLALSLDDFPVIQVAVTGVDDVSALSDEISRTTLGELQDIDGVREASIVGKVGQRVTITPNADELAARGISVSAITDALQQNGVLLPAGTITEDDKTFSVQTGSRITTLDELTALPVLGATEAAPVDPDALSDAAAEGFAGANGLGAAAAAQRVPLPTTIADVATVALEDNPAASISRVDGEPALTIAITKLPAANTVDVSKAVRDMLPSLQSSLDSTNPGATFTVVFDQAPFIEQSIESLAVEGMLGLFFAILVILLFLLSVRATLVTAISIPTSVMITFIGLQAADYTLNILTLGALTISIGRVVDDSIVVIENIKRHLVAGQDKAATIVKAVKEVAGAITASTITTVAVFVPIAMVEGVTGELFRPFSLTVTIALLASLLVSLTIVPVLAYWFLKPSQAHKHADLSTEALADETGIDELEHPSRLQQGYLPVIRWTLNHGVATLLVAVLVLGATIAMVPLMKTNFLGSSGQNTFQVSQELPIGTSLAALDTASTEVEQVLRETEGVEIVQTSIGGGSGLSAAFGGGGGSTITYSITTEDGADNEAIQAEVRTELDELSDVGEITIAASSGFGASSDIEVDITASNAADLQQATDEIKTALDDLDSISQTSTNLSESRAYIGVEVNRDEAAAAGYSEVALGSVVSQAMQPKQSGSIVIDETTLTIYIASANPPTTIEALSALEIPTVTGPVRLDTLATVAELDGPASITTVRGLRSATVTATPNSDDLGTASSEVSAAIATADIPDGTTATLGGVTADQSDAFSQLGLALLVAILIVYIVMVATFRSLLQPLLLLVSVPFAATGAIALQVITGIPLGVASLIGVLML
ncbi:MAG: efflux RND transporter permease subunit, partial [Microterricola sp.]